MQQFRSVWQQGWQKHARSSKACEYHPALHPPKRAGEHRQRLLSNPACLPALFLKKQAGISCAPQVWRAAARSSHLVARTDKGPSAASSSASLGALRQAERPWSPAIMPARMSPRRTARHCSTRPRANGQEQPSALQSRQVAQLV